jgi:hypothetical protein
MTRDEAIQLANGWVRARFRVVPPIAMAMELTPDGLSMASETLERELSSAEWALVGDWCVFYKCDWDTDAMGLPLRLGVKVDGKSGKTEAAFEE